MTNIQNLDLSPDEEPEIIFTNDDIPLIYQDEHIAIVHKPVGLMVHKSPIGRDHQFLLQMLRDKIGTWVYPIHRIDRPTSGLVCFGLSPECASKLNLMWDEKKVKKTYRAVVRGWIE